MNPASRTPTDPKGYSPLDCIAGVSRRFPELFAQLDGLRAAVHAHGNPWSMPPHWYLPFHTTAKALNDLPGQMDRQGRVVRRVPRSTPTLLNTLAAWRLTQGIYRFGGTLFGELCATPVSGALPTDLFTRLPEWTVYVETPGFMWAGSVLDGVFAQAGEIFDGTEGLAIVLNARADMPMFVLRLDQASLEAAIDVAINGDGGTEPALSAQMRSMLPRLVSLLLYLCSEAPELGDSAALPVRPQPKRTHRGVRMMPARRPVRWDVGMRLGASLRAAWQSAGERAESDLARESHAGPRAHIRRAHWHTILSGPRQNPIRSLRWLPPIPVNVTGPDDLVRTVRPVTVG